MKDDKLIIEQRLKILHNYYDKAAGLIDKLPDSIPQKTKDLIKTRVLGDQSLKELIDGLDSYRPPRLFLIGRTGVGKSSMINAICGSYVAEVNDTHSCTSGTQIYQCKNGERVLMDICDTRGIAESIKLDEEQTAEEMLARQINVFMPDVAIFMLNCTHRDDVAADADFLKKLTKRYEKSHKLRLPVIVVVNKCDEMAPSRHKTPAEYPPNKVEKINEVVSYYKEIIISRGLKIDDIIAVSSLIDWQTADGMEIGTENIAALPLDEKQNLQIAFDGRYNIDKLLDLLEKSIIDFEAQMGLRMAARLDDTIHRLVNHLIIAFSGIASTVALTPIPVSDIYILLLLQSLLVSMIAALSGREISLETSREFIFSMGGVATAGYVFRFIAQQSTKLLNGLLPGSGSVISSGIAAMGTKAIGKAASAYYIDGHGLSDARLIFEQAKAEAARKSKSTN